MLARAVQEELLALGVALQLADRLEGLRRPGQGALVINDPAGTISSPFFLSVPDWGRLPMVILATAATVIASQAVITGAFSVAGDSSGVSKFISALENSQAPSDTRLARTAR